MPHDNRVDAYIAKAEPFARPILVHIRDLVHAAVPDAGETVKWGMPFFEQNGERLAMMAGFKAHVGLGIFDGTPMGSGEGMGQFGKITTVGDLPPDNALVERLQATAALIAAGAVPRRKKATPKPALDMPDDLAAALAADPAAAAAFAAFPPGARREYIEWVVTAKQPATRATRIATTVAQSAEGKKFGWKYERC
ncbi:iron chaperone [Polymorphobacter fuscus]|uniref:YdhG-like domain-containing protein n=1 Tax=Sandarakinorhabdus fusca TaxID=1439888 RepID=A0A7C9GPV4_9SPHN|nr:YdeI/OmpD-associated family protein [Polymorphobacter fuscus]KAB7648484.1 hypothetical protein F9290_01870 [Polymorphobacter fuscus]MQT16011.1 hypothetical protein [Polymorphobacter fuscus]NJC07712.1 uncharacterized protein YdeI (YjbR/CyaY-like superfamily) [Polymorphobacter fuscus]